MDRDHIEHSALLADCRLPNSLRLGNRLCVVLVHSNWHASSLVVLPAVSYSCIKSFRVVEF
jgi:hypothetical protein